jgi:hypothetical protein
MPVMWNLDPPQLDPPLAFSFTVNPQGKVTDVQAPVADEVGVVAEVRKSLSRYVFEPLDTATKTDQRGTLLIRTEPGME